MFSAIKNKISNYLAKKKYLRNKDNVISFKSFFNNARSVLVLMPNDESDFIFSTKIVEFLNQFDKDITVLVSVKYFSKMQMNRKLKIIQYSTEDINKFNLPKEFLTEKLHGKSFDAVFDLERNENLFYSSVTNLAGSKFKVGFKKQKLNEFYNVLISNNDSRSGLCYERMIEALRMF